MRQVGTAWDGVALEVTADGRLFEDGRIAPTPLSEPSENRMAIARAAASKRATDRWDAVFRVGPSDRQESVIRLGLPDVPDMATARHIEWTTYPAKDDR